MKVIYLWLIRLVSFFNGWRPKKKIIYLMSFDNNVGFIKRLAQRLPQSTPPIVVLYRKETEAAATDLAAFGIQTIEFRDDLYFVTQLVPLLASAKLIFCDNYYAFLGGFIHSNRTKIVQLWHAAGAIKKFGWEDPTTQNRTVVAKRRFQLVYNQFDEYVVGSQAMGTVFEESYREPPQAKIRLLGYPRSDRYLNSEWRKRAQRHVYQVAPDLKGKRVILYAPTYRDDKKIKMPSGVAEALSADPNAVVVVKLHPLLQSLGQRQTDDNSKIRSYDQLSTSELLTVTDTLVTDYSSVAFDFSLLPNAKTAIFYMFDLDSYQKDPGIQDDFLTWLPTPPVMTVEELAKAIKANQATDFTAFNQKWNTYNDGNATNRVIDYYADYLNLKR
ncbi:CDP-glycerol glycerophosphotransferase family protein [Lentilactobacillus senioris]|uniref:CDP-glycerol glycerophosphotransferase family protein n=1 Tax=Lentilactobacillus senioris TaxID=931534 RepID=UPI0006D09501|nr:CDP-glycerol glycerophosphotransferase family protein [Lentilactobacillus senioris]